MKVCDTNVSSQPSIYYGKIEHKVSILNGDSSISKV